MRNGAADKNNGVFLTPPELANFVVGLAVDRLDCSVLDPCFGEGSLLSAARSRLSQLGSPEPEAQLSGYDIAAPCDVPLPQLPTINLRTADFLSIRYPCEDERFDVVLMNPPFVRHHLIPEDFDVRVRGILPADMRPRATSDMWAYFVVHALSFTRQHGTLAAILPWSFLGAHYARPIRQLLMENFSKIRTHVIGRRLFEKAEERVLVVVAAGFGAPCSEFGVRYSLDIPIEESPWTSVNPQTWIESPQSALAPGCSQILSEIAANLGFQPLRQFARVRIGTVTGANRFFVISRAQSEMMGLPSAILTPIVKHSNCLRGLTISSDDHAQDVLLVIPEDFAPSGHLKGYIDAGKARSLDQRYHTRKRKKWYCLRPQMAPDAFLHYMTNEVPFLVSNPERLTSTNTVHCVNFSSDISDEKRRNLRLSMLTSVSQLSIELAARTYGGGVLKIEPSAAGGILVCPGDGHAFPAHLEADLNTLLLSGKRLEAVRRADEWLLVNLHASPELVNSVRTCYEDLRALRLGLSTDEPLPRQEAHALLAAPI